MSIKKVEKMRYSKNREQKRLVTKSNLKLTDFIKRKNLEKIPESQKPKIETEEEIENWKSI